MGGKKPIKIIHLYNSVGIPFEACIGAKIDPLLEVDYRYSILAPRNEPKDPGKRVILPLSYHRTVRYGEGNSFHPPANHFHIKVDNPPHIKYISKRQDSSMIPAREAPAWIQSNSDIPAKPSPLCTELVEDIEGISNLV